MTNPTTKPASKMDTLLAMVAECDAHGTECYVSVGRYKGFMPNTVYALVKAGKVKIINGNSRVGWFDLVLVKDEAPAAQAVPAPTVADTLLEMARATMLEQFKESQWFNTAPAAARAVEPVITITGIEQRQVFISMGVIGHGAVLRPFLVGHVELGGISAKLCMRFDYGAGGLVVLEGE